MRKRHVWIATVAIVACIVAVGLGQQPADTILYNGKILTVDRNFSTAQAVAVRGKVIAAVGANDAVLKLAGPNTLKIDLKGKTVTPGLIHTHVHLESVGGYASELGALKTREFPVNMKAVKTKDDVIKQIRDAIEKTFKVDVEHVRTANCTGKLRRLAQGRPQGRRPDWKKAIVTVKKGQEIKIETETPK